MSFGEQLRAFREKQDLSLRELARKVGISAPFLSDIERGNRLPSDRVLRELARALGIPEGELRSGDPRPPLEGLRKLAAGDPEYSIAFREIVDSGISAAELMSLLQSRVEVTPSVPKGLVRRKVSL